jgi:uncharacterized protein (TIGR02300 family)
VAKEEWGTKRGCPNCGARFYDLRRSPIECPKCEHTFEAATPSRPSRGSAEKIEKVAATVAVAADLGAATKAESTGEDEDDADDDIDIDVGIDIDDDEDDEDDDVLEDASDLGGEEDVVPDVREHASGGAEDDR